MKHTKKYITLASMLVLGSFVTASQFEDTRETKAEDTGTYEQEVDKPLTGDEANVPLSTFELYSLTGTIWDSSEIEKEGTKVYNYTVGDNFVGGVSLNDTLRPNFTNNMTYSLTKTSFDGKTTETLVEDKKYTENMDIQVAGKGEGRYKFIVQMVNEENPNDIIVVNTTIFEQDALDLTLEVAEKDPTKATMTTKSTNISDTTYKLIKNDSTAEGGEIIKSDIIEGTTLPENLLEGLAKGSYDLEVEIRSESGLTEGITESITSTKRVTFEVTKDVALAPKSTVTKDKDVNPLEIVGAQTLEESELSWSIKDAGNKEVASEKTNQVYVPALKELSAGTYKAVFTEKATDGTESVADTDFKIVKPAIKLEVKETDPASIIAESSGVEGNAISFEITSEDDVISIGDTLEVPNALMNDLKKGTYKVSFSETDVYDNVNEKEVEFKVTEEGNAGIIEEDTTIIDGETGEVIGDNNNNNGGTTPDGDTPVVTNPDTNPNPNGNDAGTDDNNDLETIPNANVGSDSTNAEGNTESIEKNTNSERIISDEKPALQDVEIKALHWGKEVDKSVNAPELTKNYGYANIEKDSPLYLKSWDAMDKEGNYGVAAQNDNVDTIEYSDGEWRNNNVIKGVDFGRNLDELVGRYLASDEGKAYAETPEGSKAVENYTDTLKQTDKSSVMVSLGFLLTAIGLGFVLTYFFDKKKKGTVVAETKTEETPVKEEIQGFTVEEVDLKKDVETPKDEK